MITSSIDLMHIPLLEQIANLWTVHSDYGLIYAYLTMPPKSYADPKTHTYVYKKSFFSIPVYTYYVLFSFVCFV